MAECPAQRDPLHSISGSGNEGGVPTLRDLSLISVPNWYLLGLQLGVSGDELDVIERNYSRDNHMCKVKMFGTWLRADTSATYMKLARALVTLGKRNIAEALCTARGIPLTVLDDVPVATVNPSPPPLPLPPDPPECVTRYAQYLKDKYKRMPTLPDGDWPPSLGKQYTRLALIEQERKLPDAELVATMERDYIHGNIDNIVKRKKAIELPEIFLPAEDGGQQLKILMDGAPGVGKSTLSRKICKDWANGELLQQYHLVILLPLRQAPIREAISFESLICVDDLDLKQQVVHHIRRTSGEHVMLIVDGYDELSYEDRTQNSLYLDIVQGNKFSNFSVLVTSRPYASEYLQRLQSVDRHVEVLGFTEEQVEHCIMENIPDKPKAVELIQKLKERQDIASLCYIPLSCAIVLYVYEREQCTLPNSLTKLYEIFILNALKRHANTNDARVTNRPFTLSTLPEPLQKQLSALSHLAYDGLVANKMVFSIDNLGAAFPDCSDLDTHVDLLSLMTAFKGFTSSGEDLSYQFLHLTIQEFLAARWAASQLSAGELFQFFQEHRRKERYRMVLLFLAGISQLKFPSADHIFCNKLIFKHPFHIYRVPYPDKKTVNYFFFLAHLIYESQNLTLFHNLASAIANAEVFAPWYSMSPFDCLVLAHFLAWGDCSLKLLDLRNCGLTSQCLEIIHRVNLEHHGGTQVEEVDLSYNHPGLVRNLSLLPKIPSFETTQTLKIHGIQCHTGVSPNQVDLHCLLNMRRLTTLEISMKHTEIPFLMVEHYFLLLARFVKAIGNVTELQVLQLRCCKIDCHNAVNIFKKLEHNTSLEELNLLGNSQLAEGDSEAVGCAIERMLSVNRTLKVLNLNDCNVTDPIVEHILTGLTKNTSLVTLDIGSSKLSVSCAVSLFQQMTTHPTLSLVGEVFVQGVGMVKMERGTTSCVIGDMVAENCVEFFRTLNRSGIVKISTLKMKHQTAKLFHVFGCVDTVSANLLNSLELTTLEELDLSGNSQLAEGDSEAVGCAIERILNMNRTLKVLNLYDCNVTDPIVEHILTGLTKNTSLVTLDIGSSKLSVSCAVSLFQQMTTHPTLSLVGMSISGVGWLRMERETISCVIGDVIPEYCVEFFRSLNHSGMKVSTLNIPPINQTVEHVAIGLAESQLAVRKLDLKHDNISSTVAVSIFRILEHASIEKLDLSGNSQLAEGDSEAVGCAIERMLSVNRTLKVLNLNDCNVTDPIVEHILTGLTKNTSLVKLNIGSSKLSVSCAVSLFQQMTTHPTLSLVGEVCVQGVGMVEVDNYATTLFVHCSSDMIPKSCMEFFRRLNHSCTKVSVQGLTDQTVKHFAVGLAESQWVRVLNLNGMTISLNCINTISSTGAVSIFTSLEHNTSLEELDLSWNSQRVGRDGEAVGCAIERMLNVNRTLKVLKLSDCRLETAVATHIAASLTHNTYLTGLHIGWNPSITSEGWVQVFKALCNNTALKKLDISYNKLGMEGSVALAEMLSCNKSLTELILRGHIPETGLREVARSLHHNTSLKKLDISRNKLGMEGLVALAEMLFYNMSLTELNFGTHQHLPETGLSKIARGLLHNTSLHTVKLDGSSKTVLEAEIGRLGNFTSQNSRKLEIKLW